MAQARPFGNADGHGKHFKGGSHGYRLREKEEVAAWLSHGRIKNKSELGLHGLYRGGHRGIRY